MKLNTHPQAHEINAECACGASYLIASTLPEIKVTICSNCHPCFTGKQKLIDTAGRVEKFKKKYTNNI